MCVVGVERGRSRACWGDVNGAELGSVTSSEVVPSIYQLAEGLELHILTRLKPSLNGQALGIARLRCVFCAGGDVAPLISHVAFAIQPIGLDAIIDEGVQELLALSGLDVALVIKGELKAKLAELAYTVFFAQSLLHGGHNIVFLQGAVKR